MHSRIDTRTALPDGANPIETYFPALDGLRALAVLMVFVDHYGLLPEFGRGISLFLVLSGFLITRVLLDTREDAGRFQRFYLRRTLRIFPLYFSVWAVLALLTPWLHLGWNRANWLYLVYLGNMIPTFWGSQVAAPAQYVHLSYGQVLAARGTGHLIYVGHFWSLAVEEQFYLFWPMVVFWIRRAQTLLWVCAGAIAGVMVLKLAVGEQAGFPERFSKLALLHCDEFAWGALLAVALHLGYHHRVQRMAPRVLGWAVVALVAAYAADLVWSSPGSTARWDFVGVTVAADVLSVAAIALCLSRAGLLTRVMNQSLLRALGRISYGFYIFHDMYHEPLQRWIRWQVPGWSEPSQAAAVALAAFLLTLVLASLSYRYVERPFLRLKNRLARPVLA